MSTSSSTEAVVAEMEPPLRAFIESQTGGPVELDELVRIPGGFSYETWRLRGRWQEGGEAREGGLILRRSPPTMARRRPSGADMWRACRRRCPD